MLFVDTGEEVVVVALAFGVDGQFVVAAVFQRGADHPAGLLAHRSVEREEDLGVLAVRVAHAVGVLYHMGTGAHRLLVHAGFVRPRSVERGHIHVAQADWQIAGVIFGERHRLFTHVGDVGPCLHHLFPGPGAVVDLHLHGILRIFQGDGGHFGAIFLGAVLGSAVHFEVEGHVAVGLHAGYGAVVFGACAPVGGIGRVVGAAGKLRSVKFLRLQGSAVVKYA